MEFSEQVIAYIHKQYTPRSFVMIFSATIIGSVFGFIVFIQNILSTYYSDNPFFLNNLFILIILYIIVFVGLIVLMISGNIRLKNTKIERLEFQIFLNTTHVDKLDDISKEKLLVLLDRYFGSKIFPKSKFNKYFTNIISKRDILFNIHLSIIIKKCYDIIDPLNKSDWKQNKSNKNKNSKNE